MQLENQKTGTIYRWRVVTSTDRTQGYVLGRNLDEAVEELKQEIERVKPTYKLAIGVDEGDVIPISEVMGNLENRLMKTNRTLHDITLTNDASKVIFKMRYKLEKAINSYKTALKKYDH